MLNPKKIGERLKKLRGEERPEYVAWKCKLSKEAYMMYERGDRVPKVQTMVAIAEFYGVTVQELFFDE